MGNTYKLRHAVREFARVTRLESREREILREGRIILADLVATDDWLPEAYAVPSPARYQQYLLHCDSAERFSIVSFVWGPGQATPIHNHTVWGLVGMLRGAERSLRYALDPQGQLRPEKGETLLTPGLVDAVSPTIGDIHRVSNAFDDKVSISIHVYGANIGAVQRTIFEPDGARRNFTSHYSNAVLPNLWDEPAISQTGNGI